jgi:RimJ/RimL family protein N-acetyltransferase
MQIEITEFNGEKEELADFICGELWEFHGTPQAKKEKVLENIESGYYTGEGKRTFWINEGDRKIGFIRLFDLGDDKLNDETPMFDIRITKSSRGKGAGKQALKWLTEYVFTNYPNKNRFEATTRIDNIAMRRTFEKCGFVKEAHYREAWPVDKKRYDCAGYAILRNDWLNKIKTPVKFDS